MLIRTKSKHAVIAMINLALLNSLKDVHDSHNPCDAPISLSELAERQHASVSYLEQIFSDLRKADLVTSTRGPGGGYTVTSLDITVAQIVNAMHEQPPEKSTGWRAVERRVGDSLNITLRDLIL